MRSKDRQTRQSRSALGARKRRARDLRKHWSEVEARIQNAERIALFLDFDGTLAPIVGKPQDAAIPSATQRELSKILSQARFHVTLISGRRRGDLMKRAAMDGPTYLGLYGWERDAAQRAPGEMEEIVRRASELIKPALQGIRNVWIEDKSLSLAIHFLSASPAEKRRAKAAVLRVLKPLLRRELRIERNLRDWEILPRSCGDKGVAVREISRNGARAALPIYIGDDVSDEAAFRALKHGVTIRVGPGAGTNAAYFVPSPADISLILQRMAAVTQ